MAMKTRTGKTTAVAIILLAIAVLGFAVWRTRPQLRAYWHNVLWPGDRRTAEFQAALKAGERFRAPFGPGLTFLLEPTKHGWHICIHDDRGTVDISRLTPPFHFVPNPREIEGWHFRNRENTGPNGAGPKNVNAPQELRGFIFSPEVGRSIQGPFSRRNVTYTDVDDVGAFGGGRLEILDYRLTGFEPGTRASFTWMKFRVTLSWRRDYQRPSV
jgi:hypothetical protein